MSKSHSAVAYAVRLTKPNHVELKRIEPTLRNTDTPLYLARCGYRYDYDAIECADLVRTRAEARFLCEETGDKVVKVRVTITEIV